MEFDLHGVGSLALVLSGIMYVAEFFGMTIEYTGLIFGIGLILFAGAEIME